MQSQPLTKKPQEKTRDLAAVILQNTLVMTIASWMLKIANFFYLIVVIRQLGDTGYGQYATVLAFVGMFGVFFELGMTQYVERSLAQGKGQISDLLGNLIALRGILATAALLFLPLLAFIFDYEPILIAGVLIYTGLFVLAAFLMPLISVLNAAERFDAVAALQVRTQLLSIGVGLLVLFAGGGFIGLLLVGYIVLPMQIVMTIWAIRRLGLGPLRFNVKVSRWSPLLKAGIPFGLTSLALTFNFHADTVILSALRSSSEVGWYSAAYGLIFKLVAIADGLLLTMTPSLAREHVHNPERVQAWTSETVTWLSFFGFPAAVGLAILAEPITLLLFGASFAPGAPALALLALDIPLLLFTAFCGSVAVAVGLEWPAARIYLISTGLNLTLNLIFIPIYGIIAAAAITVFTDAVSALLFLHLLGGRMQFARTRSRILRIGVAAAVMGICVLFVRQAPLAGAIGIGAVVYAALALALRLVDQRVLRQGIQRMRSRMRPTAGKATGAEQEEPS
jgi:O-antigen/teichoic acid export membrane protein